eukprot:g1488.t1
MIASRRTGIRRGHGPINHFAPSHDIFGAGHQPDGQRGWQQNRHATKLRSISSEVHDIQAATDQLARSQDDTSGELDAAFGRMTSATREVGAPSWRAAPVAAKRQSPGSAAGSAGRSLSAAKEPEQHEKGAAKAERTKKHEGSTRQSRLRELYAAAERSTGGAGEVRELMQMMKHRIVKRCRSHAAQLLWLRNSFDSAQRYYGVGHAAISARAAANRGGRHRQGIGCEQFKSIVRSLLPDVESSEITAVFATIDQNCTGVVCFRDLQMAFVPQTLHSGADNIDDGTEVLDTEVIRVEPESKLHTKMQPRSQSPLQHESQPRTQIDTKKKQSLRSWIQSQPKQQQTLGQPQATQRAPPTLSGAARQPLLPRQQLAAGTVTKAVSSEHEDKKSDLSDVVASNHNKMAASTVLKVDGENMLEQVEGEEVRLLVDGRKLLRKPENDVSTVSGGEAWELNPSSGGYLSAHPILQSHPESTSGATIEKVVLHNQQCMYRVRCVPRRSKRGAMNASSQDEEKTLFFDSRSAAVRARLAYMNGDNKDIVYNGSIARQPYQQQNLRPKSAGCRTGTHHGTYDRHAPPAWVSQQREQAKVQSFRGIHSGKHSRIGWTSNGSEASKSKTGVQSTLVMQTDGDTIGKSLAMGVAAQKSNHSSQRQKQQSRAQLEEEQNTKKQDDVKVEAQTKSPPKPAHSMNYLRKAGVEHSFVAISCVSSEKQIEQQREFERRYTLGRFLDKGAFASVRLGWSRPLGGEQAGPSSQVAIKSYDRKRIKQAKDPGILRHLEQELAIVGKFDHVNIACPSEKYVTPNHVHLVMEYAQSGSLARYVRSQRRMREHTVRNIFRQIVAGVAFLHENNLCHRDIKMENCVVTRDGVVKLIDFGLGAKTDDLMCSTVCGSPEYMAPELVAAIGTDGLAKKIKYSGKPVDIWALGILLYGLIMGGRFPFSSSTMKGIFHNIRLGRFDMPPSASPPCRALLKAMLDREPSGRLTIQDVLAHEFLKTKQTGTSVSPADATDRETTTRPHQYMRQHQHRDRIHSRQYAVRRHNRAFNMGMIM